MTTNSKDQKTDKADKDKNHRKTAMKTTKTSILYSEKTKRAITQRKENPLKTENSFENTLCKISESGLEQLSIVQSEDLYKDCEDKHISNYNNLIIQKIEEKKYFKP